MSLCRHLGDCLDVMPGLDAGSIDLILADLPYGTTACKWDTVIPFAPLWAHYRRLLKPRGAVVLTASGKFTFPLAMSNFGWFRYKWTWIRGKRRTGFLDVNRRPLRCVEDILVFAPNRTTYNPIKTSGHDLVRATHGRAKSAVYHGYGRNPTAYESRERYPAEVLTIDLDDARIRHHRTQKPVALMEYLIRTYTNEGETVLDNTMGSGTTLVACLNTGRCGIGIEKDPEIFAVAEKRIAAAQAARAELLIA
jgi:DNA modification methylase